MSFTLYNLPLLVSIVIKAKELAAFFKKQKMFIFVFLISEILSLSNNTLRS